jgi:hypothetical protein
VSETNRILTSTTFNGAAILDRTRSGLSIQTGGNALSFGFNEGLATTVGNASFQSPTASSIAAALGTTEIVDLNGDGYPDLLTASSSPDTVYVRLGRNDGTFSPFGTSSASGDYPTSTTLADVNNDVHEDLLTVSALDNSASIRRGS